GSSSQAALTGSPPGPVTVTGCQRAPGTAAASTSSVPSPPSASGRQVTWSPGRCDSQPPASAEAASAAPMLPLNESGAMTICPLRPAGGGVAGPGGDAGPGDGPGTGAAAGRRAAE